MHVHCYYCPLNWNIVISGNWDILIYRSYIICIVIFAFVVWMTNYWFSSSARICWWPYIRKYIGTCCRSCNHKVNYLTDNRLHIDKKNIAAFVRSDCQWCYTCPVHKAKKKHVEVNDKRNRIFIEIVHGCSACR